MKSQSKKRKKPSKDQLEELILDMGAFRQALSNLETKLGKFIYATNYLEKAVWDEFKVIKERISGFKP